MFYSNKVHPEPILLEQKEKVSHAVYIITIKTDRDEGIGEFYNDSSLMTKIYKITPFGDKQPIGSMGTFERFDSSFSSFGQGMLFIDIICAHKPIVNNTFTIKHDSKKYTITFEAYK